MAGGPLVLGKSKEHDAGSSWTGGDDGGAAPERFGNRAGQRHEGIEVQV
jgi:hypothetical protein